MTEIIFSKWIKLGAGFSGVEKCEDPIDIELLLIETIREGRTAPILIDVMLGWLSLYGELVNVHRLRKIIPEKLSPYIGAVFEFFIKKTGQRKFLRILDHCKPADEGVFLFQSSIKYQSLALEAIENATEVNDKWNVYWKSLEIKADTISGMKSILSNNPILALRSVFGTNMKADIIGYIYLFGKATIKELAQYLHFDVAAVSRELTKMEDFLFIKKKRIGRFAYITLSDLSSKLVQIFV